MNAAHDRSPRRPTTLVIGYGNTLRQDDGLGRVAAARLAASLSPEQAAAVEIDEAHQLTLELAARIVPYARLILIDAARPTADHPPGSIQQIDVTPAQAAGHLLGHYLEPGTLLAAAQALYGHAPRTVLLTITGAAFDHGAGLSPAVTAALPDLLTRLRDLLAAPPASPA